MNIQNNSSPSIRNINSQDNSGMRKRYRKAPWRRQFRDKVLLLQLQIDSLGQVVKSSNPPDFRQLEEPKQKASIDGLGDVVHENSYAAFEHLRLILWNQSL